MLLTLFLVAPSPARQSPGQGANGWLSFAPPGEEFSVALPAPPATYFDYTEQDYKSKSRRDFSIGGAEIKGERTYSVYNDGVVYLVQSYKTSAPGKLRSGLKADELKSGDLVREFELDGFKVMENRSTTETDFRVLWFIAARSHAYRVEAAARNVHPSVARFLESFRLNNRNPAGVEEFSNLTAVEANAKVGATGASAPDPGEVFNPKELTRKVALIWRPEPLYTDAARRNQITGSVRLTMIAASSGEITNIRVVTKLPDVLTDTAIAAARVIKFLPAEKDGRRVSQRMTIDYNYNIY
jgi:TonB family protein